MNADLRRALADSGDPTLLTTYTQALAEVRRPLRVGIAAGDAVTATRHARRLAELFPDVEFTRLYDIGSEPETRWLGLHALVWVTAPPSPLSASEREGLVALAGLGAPERRVITLVDREIFARLSDDPDAEWPSVLQRVQALAPPTWPTLDDADLGPWLRERVAEVDDLRQQRPQAVTNAVVTHALLLVQAALTAEHRALRELDVLLTAHDEVLATAVRRAERDAAHVLGVAKRFLEPLRLEFAAFCDQLDADLPAQLAGVASIDVARDAGPRWLQHVITSWLHDAIATWRANVLGELAALHIDADAAERAMLLLPAIHPAFGPPTPDWRHRLVLTATLAGGAALLVFGQLPLGLAAIGGGLVWANTGQLRRDEDARVAWIDAARHAVARLRADVDQRLADQLLRLERDLSEMTGDRRRTAGEADAEVRAELNRRRPGLEAHLEQLAHTEAVLQGFQDGSAA